MRDMLDISDAAIDSLAEEMVGLAGDSDNLLSPDQVSELAA